jgi:AraC-like DNA-binding protein/mannose-6-phosphate isomerase-like protein (cupin superfamily)
MTQNGQDTRGGSWFTRDPVDPGDVIDPARPVLGFGRDDELFRTGWHRHRRAQLLLTVEGVMTVSTKTGTWVVPPQQAVWVPPGTEHDVSADQRIAMRSLYIDPSVLDPLPKICCVLTVPPLLRELILRAVALPADYAPDGPEARLMAVIPDELAGLKPEPLYLPLPADPRLRAVTDVLIADPADGRDLKQWAKTAGASERTLARLFVKETGMTFGTWRQRRRLLAAIGRLAEGQPVTSVAFDLGYDSPSAFITMFRRTLGATPGRYLQQAPIPADERAA